jgi:hypothetical protein
MLALRLFLPESWTSKRPGVHPGCGLDKVVGPDEAAPLALRLRPLTALDQEQDSGSASGEARSGGGLGQGEMAIAPTRAFYSFGKIGHRH